MGLAQGPGWPGTGKGHRVCDEDGKSGRDSANPAPRAAQIHTQLPWHPHAHACAIHARQTDKHRHHGAATFTDACVLVEVVAKGALALEAPKSVHTVAALAEARQLLALVDI